MTSEMREFENKRDAKIRTKEAGLWPGLGENPFEDMLAGPKKRAPAQKAGAAPKKTRKRNTAKMEEER